MAHPQLRRPRLPLRTPRTQRETCCRGRCGDVQHDGQHYKFYSITTKNYMGMSTSAAARSPFSIRSASCAIWATRCSSRCVWLSLWALTPPLPLLDDVMMCMGPRASRRSRPGSLTAAHEGLTLIFGFSTRSRAPIARTTHQRPLSPFQILRREAPKRQNPAGVIVTHFDACYDIHIDISLYIYIYTVRRPGAFGLSVRSCTPGPSGDLARVGGGSRGG